MNRYRHFLSRRREERERRARLDRLASQEFGPVLDDPIELRAEPIDLSTGLPCERRAATRR